MPYTQPEELDEVLLPWRFSHETIPKIGYFPPELALITTADFGNTWLVSDGGIPGHNQYNFDLLVPSRVWSVGYGFGQVGIFVSNNYGIDWELCSDSLSFHAEMFSIGQSPIHPNILLSGGYDANGYFICRSDDGGNNWRVTTPAFPNEGERSLYNPIGIYFSHLQDSLVFLAAEDMWDGQNGRLYKSVDNGQSWTNIDLSDFSVNEFGRRTRFYFHPTIPEIMYWLREYPNSNVLRSTDGGNTWEVLFDSQPPTYTFGSLSTSSPPTLVLANGSIIWEYTDTTSFDTGLPTRTLKNNLGQIEAFPNPTNTSVTIRSRVLQAGVYRLTVYNMLGQRVLEEPSIQYSQGRFIEILDMSAHPSGSYFLTLSSTETSFTTQILLLK